MSDQEFIRHKLSSANTPRQQAALLALIEECGEVAHAAAKALRFGLRNFHPDNPIENNAEQIARELGDVREAYDRLCAATNARKTIPRSRRGLVDG